MRKDGAYRNLVTGLGDPMADKSSHNQIATSAPLDPKVLSNIYMADGIGASIVDAVAEDAVSKGWEVAGDAEGRLWSALSALKFPTMLENASKWTRLYGGGLIILLYKEANADLKTPAPKGKPVVGMRFFSAGRLDLKPEDVVTKLSSPYFDQIELFKVLRRDGTEFQVHASRCVILQGSQAPDCWDHALMNHVYFGVSCLQQVYDRLAGMGVSVQGIEYMLSEPDIAHYAIKGFTDMLSNSENAMKRVSEQIQAMNMSKSLLRGIFMDADDNFHHIAHNFTGVPDALRVVMLMVCATSRIPFTRLFGEGAKGLNATGEGDMQNYHDLVRGFQTKLTPAVLDVCRAVNAGMPNPIPENGLNIEWSPVWSPSLPQMVDMRLKQAQTDKLYWDMGVAEADEIRKTRFAGGYSYETILED